MIATLLVGLLCLYLMCFTLMFLLISRRLHADRMGVDVFALGNFLLGVAYVLQLLEGAPGWSAMSVINHTLTVCSPVAYALGAARFFGRPVAVIKPLLVLAAGYSLAQLTVHLLLGMQARYVLLSATCALQFAAMALVLLYGLRGFACTVRVETLLFASLISGLCVLNLLKLQKLWSGGMQALAMDSQFQMIFYAYMCSLATILPPAIVWLVLRRLTDDLRNMAARDPLTQLLNRRGLDAALQRYFRHPGSPAWLLLVDVDHFKSINDGYGHHLGDIVLCAVAGILQAAAGRDCLVCRLGGEEFVLVCRADDASAVSALAGQLRQQIADRVLLQGPDYAGLRCTVTIGVSQAFSRVAGFDQAMQQADAALYIGTNHGRNRVELAASL